MDHKILCVEKVREKSIILIGHRERAAKLVNDWKHRPLLMLVVVVQQVVEKMNIVSKVGSRMM